MKRLKIPLKDVDVRTIYQECADSFRDKTALSYIEEVVSITAAYETYVPRDIEHLPQYDIKAGDKQKIIKVYEEKFAKRTNEGYKYYEAIMANVNGRCPICGCGTASTLDHFLPKGAYPLLCVTPANLVPACYDCNLTKYTSTSMDYYSIPFNPYFDDMEDEWLECDFTVYRDNTYTVMYKNGYDKCANEKLWNKYETHLRVFGLFKSYAARALDEIETRKYRDQEMLRTCGTESIKKDLIENKNSCEKVDINSWKSALYRELVRKVDDYCDSLI